MKRVFSVLAAPLLALMLPVPAHAETSLLGYTALAQSVAVRVMIYDPTLPIPAEPQGDVGVGFTRANIQSGPAARALSSYLWPGDAVGDGIPVLFPSVPADYYVKVNSRYPESQGSPAKNTAGLTQGNAMVTSADETSAESKVTGAGITGTDDLSHPGRGVCTILQKGCPDDPVPVAVPDVMAGAATLTNVVSDSKVVVGASSVTTTSHAHASDLQILGGLIKIADVDMNASATSDGKRATTKGLSVISGLEIAGQKISLGRSVALAGASTAAPALPQPLESVGVTVDYLTGSRTIKGNSGALSGQGLVISVDSKPLYKALSVGTVASALGQVVSQVPTIGDSIAPLLTLAPKIVIVIGDVSASAVASPEYIAPPFGGDGGPGQTAAESGTTGAGAPLAGAVSPGGPTGLVPPGIVPMPSTPGAHVLQPVASTAPALGGLPNAVVLAALTLAGLLGWGFRLLVGGLLFGGSRPCTLGLDNGLPNLRKA